eukprot:CAMPEP_0176470424 /NCGR_PEP_ID=MMETSP0127-20121128/40447_1 /TAXON_ID=938130 /ORGANISM="Platyophrya macrostoma, Strain WH" /LENGTH=319 /DNA_ID=CAMNT_0017864715 /DNA_START=187 /DNA_END=1146 /DNA_ORIENTATION=+
MGASSSEYPGGISTHRGCAVSNSPDRHSSGVRDATHDEEGSQLLRLIDEATHALSDDHEGCPHGGASFMVTASASHSSLTLPGPPALPGSVATSLFGPPPGYPATAPAPPPPSNSPPPPSFAEAIAALSSPIPSVAQPPHIATSPPPFGPLPNNSSTASAPPPPPPSVHGANAGAVEPMIVRNQRGVFLLQPVSRVGAGAGAQGAHPQSHTGTPVAYPSPAPSGVSTGQPATGTSPPASPLPTYALPPPMPFLTHSIHSHHHNSSTVTGHGTSNFSHGVGVTPTKKTSSVTSHHGTSPPNYPAPPPYRSPVAKHSALGS